LGVTVHKSPSVVTGSVSEYWLYFTTCVKLSAAEQSTFLRGLHYVRMCRYESCLYSSVGETLNLVLTYTASSRNTLAEESRYGYSHTHYEANDEGYQNDND